MSVLLTILAALPFILLFVLIVIFKWGTFKTMPLIWFTTAISLIFFWKTSVILIAASFIKGTFIALEIMLIIFGAIWIITLLNKKQQIPILQNLLSSISPDARIQAILIAWLFGSLIEGLAGFGTPAALAAPLLVSIGFTPVLAVILSLIANSSAVSFGAAGTPVLLGLSSLALEGTIIQEITKNTAILHFIAGLLIPIILAYLVTSHLKPGIKKIHSVLKIIPFAIFAWLSFMIPYILIAIFIGPELPSILGALIGLLLTGLAAHYKFLAPKEILSMPLNSNTKTPKKQKIAFKKYLLALSPYFLIVAFLFITRYFTQIKNLLSGTTINYKNILGTTLTYSFAPLYTPSFYFILSGLIFMFIFKAKKSEISSTLSETFNKVKRPAIALIFALALVQLFLISDLNPESIASMPLLLAGLFSKFSSTLYIFISPFIGAFGSFLAGSNTVSNLLFGSFQLQSAITLGLPIGLILALQTVGGAIGNMIAIHNILAASATVGLHDMEWKIIRRTILVSVVYALIVGLAAFILFGLM